MGNIKQKYHLVKSVQPPLTPPPRRVMKDNKKNRLCPFLFRLAKVKTPTPSPPTTLCKAKNVSEYISEYVSEYTSKYVSEYTSEYISECTSECTSDYVREYISEYVSEYTSEYISEYISEYTSA